MARSSTSLPTSPLPFGADTRTHNAYRRSTTALGGPHHQAHPDQPDYASFVAAAQAEDARSHRASASIPPTSIRDLPRSHKTLLRRHKVLLWVVSIVFEISLIALTAGILMCAVRAHEYNEDGGGKAAFVIVGVFGFAGMIGSAAVGWLVWQGRKERARLEERWTVEEEMKERRSARETSRAKEVLRSIKERERSLSRSRSRSRGRASHRSPPAARQQRLYSELIPSFRAMTPTATEAPSVATEQVRESDWTNHLDLSTSEDDEEYRRSGGQITNERLEQEIIEHMSRPTTPGTPVPGSPNISGILLANSPTMLNSDSSPTGGQGAPFQRHNDRSQDPASIPHSPTLFDFSAIDGPPPSLPPKSPARSSPVPGRRSQYPVTSGSSGPSRTTQNTSILNFSPVIDPAGSIHPAYRGSGPFSLSPDLRSSRQNVNEATTVSTPINASSPLNGSSRLLPASGTPRQPPPNPSHSSPSSTQSPTLLNSSPVAGPTDSVPATIHPAFRTPSPYNPQISQQTSNPATATATATASTLLNSSSSPLPAPPAPPPTPTTTPPPPHRSQPPTLTRASNGHLGSAQSDENFLAMLDAHSDANSEDEARLAARRVQSQERVRAWASEASISYPARSQRFSASNALSASLPRSGEGSVRGGGRSGEAAPYLTGREDDPGGMVRRGLSRVGKGFRRFSPRLGGGR